MAVKPNASSFELHRWFQWNERTPVYEVTWENANAYTDADTGEKKRTFKTLKGALDFGRRLLETEVE
jgi:hypothetical protein